MIFLLFSTRALLVLWVGVIAVLLFLAYLMTKLFRCGAAGSGLGGGAGKDFGKLQEEIVAEVEEEVEAESL